MPITFDEFRDLWHRIEADEVYVRYDAPSRGEDGYFIHNQNPIPLPGGGWKWGPVIAVCHYCYTTPCEVPSDRLNTGELVDLTHEFMTLAHEYGHCLSFRAVSPQLTWEAYHRATARRDRLIDDHAATGCRNGLTLRDRLRDRLSSREKTLISNEEALAWRLSRPLVPERLLGEYDRRAKHGVHCHRFRMGMEGLWYEDIDPTSGRPRRRARLKRMRDVV